MMVNPATPTSRRQWLYAAVAAMGGLAAGGYMAWTRYAVQAPDDGAVAAFWRQRFEMLSGESLAMAAFQGRPLLLNFWATWCPPCVEELPLLDAFYAENSARGWQVVGLALDKAASVRTFVERHPLRFPVMLGGAAGLGLTKSLGNVSGGLPFSVLFGADGTVRGRKIGKLNQDELDRWRALE